MEVPAIACFSADVTPPLGAPLLGSGCGRALFISAPLQAHGLAITGAGAPIVLCCVDFLSIGNESHEQWRRELADAAGTTPERVVLQTLHQHSAPIEDIEAHRIMQTQRSVELPSMDAEYHRACRHATAAALREAMPRARRCTHVGTGQAKVERVASTRRLVGADGRVFAMRMSQTRKAPRLRAEPEGLIDPMLRTLSFWEGDRPIAAIHHYATHPLSYYGGGEVGYDFVGVARERRRADAPGTHQIYATGCAGDLAPGKYNDGSPQSRVELADRVYGAMLRAWSATRTHPIERVEFRVSPLALTPGNALSLSEGEALELAADTSAPCYERMRAAYYLSYHRRHAAGHRIQLPVIDLGPAVLTLLPGEPFIAYQHAAQAMRPDAMVMVLGYGDYGPVYVPTAAAYDEGGYEPGEWCFVGRESEAIIHAELAGAVRSR